MHRRANRRNDNHHHRHHHLAPHSVTRAYEPCCRSSSLKIKQFHRASNDTTNPKRKNV